jgi:hypothetical protein
MMKTLSEAMESLVRRGFTEHFGVRGDQLRGFESGKTFGFQDVIIRHYDRFEGVSDPDDMAILYALESSSGIHGTLVDAFGVYSNPAISAFLARVRFVGTGHLDRPDEDGSARPYGPSLASEGMDPSVVGGH